MYNNYNSNRPTDGLSVNTQFMMDYCDTAKITVSGWNDKVSIRLNRSSGKNADGLSMYNEQDYFNTAMTKDVIDALIDGIDNIIIPAIKEMRNASIAVQTSSNENGSNVIEILVAPNDKNGFSVFLNAHKYGQAGPIDTFTHEFRQKNYLRDFNPMTNQGDVVVVQAKFMQFVAVLRTALIPVAVTAHGEKFRAKIAEAYNNNRPNNGGNSYGNKGYQNNNPNPQPTNEYTPSYNPAGLEDGFIQ